MLQEEACRAPIVLAYMQNLRKQIMKQRDGEWLQPGTFRHPCNEETRLLDLVGDFLKAFSLSISANDQNISLCLDVFIAVCVVS